MDYVCTDCGIESRCVLKSELSGSEPTTCPYSKKIAVNCNWKELEE